MSEVPQPTPIVPHVPRIVDHVAQAAAQRLSMAASIASTVVEIGIYLSGPSRRFGIQAVEALQQRSEEPRRLGEEALRGMYNNLRTPLSTSKQIGAFVLGVAALPTRPVSLVRQTLLPRQTETAARIEKSKTDNTRERSDPIAVEIEQISELGMYNILPEVAAELSDFMEFAKRSDGIDQATPIRELVLVRHPAHPQVNAAAKQVEGYIAVVGAYLADAIGRSQVVDQEEYLKYKRIFRDFIPEGKTFADFEISDRHVAALAGHYREYA